MQQVNFRARPEQAETLDNLSEQTDRGKSQIIRDALDEHFSDDENAHSIDEVYEELLEVRELVESGNVSASASSSTSTSSTSSSDVTGALSGYDPVAEDLPDDLTPHGRDDVLSKDVLREFAAVMDDKGVYNLPALNPDHLVRDERPQGDDHRTALTIALLKHDNNLVSREDVLDVLTADGYLDYTSQYVRDQNVVDKVLDRLVENPLKDDQKWIVTEYGKEQSVREAFGKAKSRVDAVAEPDSKNRVKPSVKRAQRAIENLERLEDATGVTVDRDVDLEARLEDRMREGQAKKGERRLTEAVEAVEEVEAQVEEGVLECDTVASVDKQESGLLRSLPDVKSVAGRTRTVAQMSESELTEDEITAFEARAEEVRDRVQSAANEQRASIHEQHQQGAEEAVEEVEEMVADVTEWMSESPGSLDTCPVDSSWVLRSAASEAEDAVDVCGCIEDVEVPDVDSVADNLAAAIERVQTEEEAWAKRENDRVLDAELERLTELTERAAAEGTDEVWGDVSETAKAAYKAASCSHRDMQVVRTWVADMVDAVERLRMDERDRSTKPRCVDVTDAEDRSRPTLRALMDDSDVETETR